MQVSTHIASYGLHWRDVGAHWSDCAVHMSLVGLHIGAVALHMSDVGLHWTLLRCAMGACQSKPRRHRDQRRLRAHGQVGLGAGRFRSPRGRPCHPDHPSGSHGYPTRLGLDASYGINLAPRGVAGYQKEDGWRLRGFADRSVGAPSHGLPSRGRGGLGAQGQIGCPDLAMGAHKLAQPDHATPDHA